MARTYAKYAKYGAIAPKNLISTSPTGFGTVVATPYYADSEYICNVTIGGQTLRLNFDTGSSDL